MRVAVGADHAGYELKQHLIAWLRTQGHDVPFTRDAEKAYDAVRRHLGPIEEMHWRRT